MKTHNEAALKVCELFRSIAGETTHAGRAAAFCRLAGCNLRCRWCDTKRSWEEGREISSRRLLQLLKDTPEKLVVITGGEPLLQSGTVPLCSELSDAGKQVLLETNGSLDVSGVPEGTNIILDIKCPGSLEHERNHWPNLDRLRPGDEVKLVLADRKDFEWTMALLDNKRIPTHVQVLLAPAANLLNPTTLAAWILESGCGARLQLQLHRILWPNGSDGVAISW